MNYIVKWIEWNLIDPDALKYDYIYMPEINEVNWVFTLRRSAND